MFAGGDDQAGQFVVFGLIGIVFLLMIALYIYVSGLVMAGIVAASTRRVDSGHRMIFERSLIIN